MQGKEVTGFTNGEEEAVGLTKVVPFLVEDEMLKLGAVFSKKANWAVHVVTDGLLITGQNPAFLGPSGADADGGAEAKGQTGCPRCRFVDLGIYRATADFLVSRPAAARRLAAGRREERMVRTHQPGQTVFRSILPEDIDWKPFPAFPPSVRLAIVVGQPSEPGPYTIRVKVPSGVKLMPHKHPEDRVYTVLSGVFYIGLGNKFDGDKVEAYPPGSVVVLPGNTSHFHWAKSGEYITQVTAIGPLGIDYVDLGDDPREQNCE